jgi:hypothetical protein
MKNLTCKLCAAIATLFALSSLAIAQTNPPAWSSTASYKIGDIVSYEGIDFQCLLNETTTHPNPHVPADWDIYFVYSGNVTVPVGPTAACTSLTSAWSYIKYARIAVGASITISLQSNYSESFNTSFSLDHPFGAQIFIIGNDTSQIASFPKAGAGFVLDTGHTLGGLEGLTIVGPTKGSNGTPAVEVKDKALLSNASNLYIQSFDIGLETDSGEINNVSALYLHQFITGGVLSSGHGAVINITGAITIEGNNTSSNVPAYGFEATQGGSINCCPSCAANDCLNNFCASNNGAIYCFGSSSTDSTTNSDAYLDCYSATNHGFISAEASQASGGAYGFSSDGSSYIYAERSKALSYGNFGYYATHLSQIDAQYSLGGTTNNDSSSLLLTGAS